MENEEKQDILRAKQAISPAGLGDRSDKAMTLPGNESPDDTSLSGIDSTPSMVDEDDDSATTHPNRHANGKVEGLVVPLTYTPN